MTEGVRKYNKPTRNNNNVQTHFTIAFLFVPLVSQSASFDCAKATTNVEKLICQDTPASRTISELDSRMSDAHTLLLASSADTAVLKKEQRNWLNDVRNKCLDVTCLETAYTRRIEQLTKNAGTANRDEGAKQGQIAVGKRDVQVTQNLSCDKNVESVLDEALRHAKSLSSNDSRSGPMSGNEVRSGYFYLLPDIAANYADAGCLDKADDILSTSREMLADQLKSDLASSLIRIGLPDKAEELIRTLDSPEKQSGLLVELAALHIRLNDD